ncbi:hypothetical protein CLM62_12880 [Streptomyces sp. SA15]|uniref:hypothetical protein n=1 Tax=Streptomyces sp. SA15 TaxID=934019 RepID=UPI000BB016D7|nr:hypothetical protein [Streptomyces sp. SA15]PAZ15685.1 hypothetical protein CLM62_12880 [Streptomyces sp. SA15]
MIIIYAPEGETEQHFDAGKLRASEIQIVERTLPGRWSEIKDAVSEGEINALRTVAWVIRKRTEPGLRYGDFDPWEGELRARLDAREVKGYAEALLEKYRANPDDLADAWDELRDSAFNREDADAAIADVTAPKDPAPAPEQESPASPSE